MAENDERLRYDAALELRGESAAGSADRWLKGARALMSETGSSLDPESRKGFERRATYLIQGKYENLKRHEAREVRAGRIARLETDTADSAAKEANDILKQTQSLEDSLGGETRLAGLVRDEAMKNAGDDKEKQKAAEEAYAQRMGGLFLRRKADSERLIVQIGATTMMNEDRFQTAVDQGLFDQPTADALRRKYQRTVMDTTVGTLLQGGQADQAEAFVAALEDNDRALALSMGYTPEDVAKMRSGVEAVRAKRTADAERAKEEATKRAQDAARETEIGMALTPVPDDEKARAAHYAEMAAQYRAMAQDKALDAETRLQYANAAARLSAPKGGKSAANAPRPVADAKSVEENLTRRFNALQMLELDRSIGTDDAAKAQAALWRDYHVAVRDGLVSGSFMGTFQGRMSTRLSAQEANAMRKFYQAFGYKGEVGSDGQIPLQTRKSEVFTYYSAPHEADDRHSDSHFEIPAQELFRYGDELLKALKSLGPDVSREGVIDREIARMKTKWWKGKFDRNIQESLKTVMNAQREAATQRELHLAKTEKDRNEKKDDDDE